MKKYFLIIAVILFASCHKDSIANDDLLIFSFHCGGSWSGLDENLEINVYATHYSVSYRDLQTSENISYQTTIKTPEKQWVYVIKTFDLKTFRKIKDGQCYSCVDGFDTTFSVTIKDKTYSIYNGEKDEHYKQMQDFFDAILEQVTIFRNQI